MSDSNPGKPESTQNSTVTLDSQDSHAELAPDLEAALREAEAHAKGLEGSGAKKQSERNEGAKSAQANDEPQRDEVAQSSDDELNAVRAELEAAQQQAAEMKDGMLRARADLENARRRFEREKREDQLYAGEKVLKALIPIVDDLDRALDNLPAGGEHDQTLIEGVQMVHRKFLQALDSQGAKSFYPQGEVFDPTNHEAMMEMPSEEVEPGHIAQVFQRGWLLNERLLRPAKVIIAKAP